jgi:hypothetical protein
LHVLIAYTNGRGVAPQAAVPVLTKQAFLSIMTNEQALSGGLALWLASAETSARHQEKAGGERP